MSALIGTRNIFLKRLLINSVTKHRRTIATSKKNNDKSITADCAVTPGNLKEEPKDWVSYGFDYNSKEEDTNAHHATYFFSVTICLVLGGFYYAYSPDVHMRDWAQREAFIELRRREKLGLPAISPDYVGRQSICLPSDKELKDVEIII